MRAADGGESARFTGSFLASSFFCSQTFLYARPLSAANASRSAAEMKTSKEKVVSNDDLPNADVLTIKQCPKCGKSHKYQLNVERALFMHRYRKVPVDMLKSTKKEFTRLFTCPITKEDFQARFNLVESSAIIMSVKVKGVLNEDEEKQK